MQKPYPMYEQNGQNQHATYDLNGQWDHTYLQSSYEGVLHPPRRNHSPRDS